MKEKFLIITAMLVRESWGKTDKELEAEIRKEISPKKIPYCERIEKISVIS